MPGCASCSAPLPTNTSLCSYCGTRNDLDVMATRRFTGSREGSRRCCPDCRLPMETIRLSDGRDFAVERCPTCFGLFFDPGEVQSFIEESVTPAFVVNYQEIVNINRERANLERTVRYIECPECRKLMNRISFGPTSGVVLDQCKDHGVWLDNGELIHLMEWKRAGGQLLAERRRKPSGEKVAAAAPHPPFAPVKDVQSAEDAPAPEDPLNNLLDTAVKLLNRLLG